jgi:hypothetical protein
VLLLQLLMVLVAITMLLLLLLLQCRSAVGAVGSCIPRKCSSWCRRGRLPVTEHALYMLPHPLILLLLLLLLMPNSWLMACMVQRAAAAAMVVVVVVGKLWLRTRALWPNCCLRQPTERPIGPQRTVRSFQLQRICTVLLLLHRKIQQRCELLA